MGSKRSVVLMMIVMMLVLSVWLMIAKKMKIVIKKDNSGVDGGTSVKMAFRRAWMRGDGGEEALPLLRQRR